MKSVKEIVKELKIFERNKIPEEIKILGIAIYFQTSSSGELQEFYQNFTPVSYNAVRRWVKK